MARLCQKLGRGEQLRALAPRLRSTKELPEAQVNELLAQVQLEELRAAGERRDVAGVNAAWAEVPRATRRLPQAIATYARALMLAGDHVAAEKLLREAIDDGARARARAPVRRRGPAGPARAARSRGALAAQVARRPELLAASAKLALRAELIGKARSYLEASLARKPTPENALLYAELLEQLGEGDRARASCATAWRARWAGGRRCRA